MLELEVQLDAGQVLDECSRRGLVVAIERQLGGCDGGRHWHLRHPERPGTLELNACGDRVWVKVHPRRDGGWASALATELHGVQGPAAVPERP
ncbi:MAG: hypothetical protein J2P45_26620 [Candidatus Dormibacteraeota bacterium]|nr:hypothetical protein [Candidatus Dormibacteraeota bacterium]